MSTYPKSTAPTQPKNISAISTSTVRSAPASDHRVLIVLLVVFLLAGVGGFLLWYFFQKTNSPSLPGAPSTSGTPTSTPSSSTPSAPSSTTPSAPSSTTPSAPPPPSSGPQLGNYGTSSDFPGQPGVAVQAGPGAFSSTLVSSLDPNFNGNWIHTNGGEYLMTPDGLFALWVPGSFYAPGGTQTPDLQTYFGNPVIVEVATKTIVGPANSVVPYPISTYWSFPPSGLQVNNDGSLTGIAAEGSGWESSPFCPQGKQCVPPFTASLGYNASGIPIFQVVDSNNVQVFQILGEAP